MGGSGDTTTSNNEQRNVDAFYQVVWPFLEKEGGWTLVRFYCIIFLVVCEELVGLGCEAREGKS